MSELKYMMADYYGDGMGQQIQRRISIWAYCKLNNLKYVHNPIESLQHNYLNDGEFENKADNFFNLGDGELSIDDVDSSQIITKLCMNDYFNKNGVDLYDKVRGEFREKYFRTPKPEVVYDSAKKNIAVHVRRGDIVGKKHRFRKRGNDDQYFISLMEDLNKRYNKKCKFYLFSQTKTTKNGKMRKANLSMFDNFKKLNMDIQFVINGCPFSDIHHIMMSDIIIMSKSAFSYVPALFSNAHVIYNKFWDEPKSYWEIR